jgi:hypothetical protein
MKGEDPNCKHQADAGRSPAQEKVESDAYAGSDESGTK